jgi:hypothetical protein
MLGFVKHKEFLHPYLFVDSERFVIRNNNTTMRRKIKTPPNWSVGKRGAGKELERSVAATDRLVLFVVFVIDQDFVSACHLASAVGGGASANHADSVNLVDFGSGGHEEWHLVERSAVEHHVQTSDEDNDVKFIGQRANHLNNRVVHPKELGFVNPHNFDFGVGSDVLQYL